MAHLLAALSLAAALAIPALVVAQPARGPAAPAPPPAPRAEEWGGEVVAIDPQYKMVCLRRSDGQLIEFGVASAEVLKQHRIGMKITSLPPALEPAPRLVRTCPFPPPLTTTYKAWMEATSVTLATRDSELKAVDDALKRYWDAGDDWQRAVVRADVQKAFDAWKIHAGKDGKSWRDSPRNAKKAAERLDAQLGAKAVVGVTALKPLDQWTGNVVAIDPALGVVCVLEKNGQMIELGGGSAETLRQFKIGMEISGAIAADSGGPSGRDALPRTIKNCPFPPPLTVTYQQWMTDTAVRLSTRDAVLKAVDDALKRYWDARDDWQRATIRPDVQKAFEAWKATLGDVSGHPRWGNAAKALDIELRAKAIAGATQEEMNAWAVVEQHNRDALAEMFTVKDKNRAKEMRLVPKTTSALQAVNDAHEKYKEASDAAKGHLPDVLDPLDAEKRAEEVVDLVLGDVKEKLIADFTEFKTKLQEIIISAVPILSKLPTGGPVGRIAKEWKDTFKAAWTAHEFGEAKPAFAPGDPSAAFEAMQRALARDTKKEAAKAGVATVAEVTKLLTAAIPGVPQAIEAAKALANSFLQMRGLAREAEKAKKANELLEQGKIDANLFEASSLLAAYYLANADTSAVIYLARPFGVTGYTRITDETVKQARPVLDQAREMILSASYEIPALRHMKGGTVDSTAKTAKVLPKGKLDKAKQDLTDAVNRDSAGQAPQAPVITPTTTTVAGMPPAETKPFLFSRHWIEWTEVPLRPRSAELKALDDAVKTWGEGRSDPEVLRDGVWVALRTWQAKEGSGWEKSARNLKSAFTALEKKVAPATGPVSCPWVPNDCNGPWSEKERDASWPPCADPPPGGCKQVVLGRFGDIQRYLSCPGYITLNTETWSAEKNERFIACAASGRLGANCTPPILIASGKTNIPDTTITARELGQLSKCGCTMTVNQTTPGFALACPQGMHGPVACPLVPRSCAGPWQNQAPFPDQPRPADYPKCAEPPWNGGKQVVLGRHDDIKQYIGCPGYITLNLSNWTKDKDNEFIACAAAGKLGATAEPPILIASGWDSISPDPNAFRALAQLRMCKCTMQVAEHGPGSVTRCPPPVSASLPGLARLFPRPACGGTPTLPSGWQLLVDLVWRGPGVLAGSLR